MNTATQAASDGTVNQGLRYQPTSSGNIIFEGADVLQSISDGQVCSGNSDIAGFSKSIQLSWEARQGASALWMTNGDGTFWTLTYSHNNPTSHPQVVKREKLVLCGYHYIRVSDLNGKSHWSGGEHSYEGSDLNLKETLQKLFDDISEVKRRDATLYAD